MRRVCVILLSALITYPSVMLSARANDVKIFLRVNQLGYQPTEAKIAIGFARFPLPKIFSVVNAVTGAVALEGLHRLITGKWGDPEPFTA